LTPSTRPVSFRSDCEVWPRRHEPLRRRRSAQPQMAGAPGAVPSA
jgi:hypothetical protein